MYVGVVQISMFNILDMEPFDFFACTEMQSGTPSHSAGQGIREQIGQAD